MCSGSLSCSSIPLIISERSSPDDKVLVRKVSIVDIGVTVPGLMDVDDVDIFPRGKLQSSPGNENVEDSLGTRWVLTSWDEVGTSLGTSMTFY